MRGGKVKFELFPLASLKPLGMLIGEAPRA
jgi:hypothetical protein